MEEKVFNEKNPFCCIFGDDFGNYILKFDFITETFKKITPPKNLKLYGYS